MKIAHGTASTAATTIGLVDLTGHSADLLLDMLNVSGRIGASGGSSTGTFKFDSGTLDATGITVSTRNGDNRNATSTGTVELGGGTVTVGDAGIVIANNTADTTEFSANAVGTVTINGTTTMTVGATGGTSVLLGNSDSGRAATATFTVGGTADVSLAGDIVEGAGAGNAAVVSTFNLSGGALDMNGNEIGSAAAPINNVNLESGTLTNLGELNGGATLTKTTSGTLTLDGLNTYTGATRVEAGTLVAAADTALGTTAAGTTVTGGTATGQLLLANGVTITGETLTLEGRSTTAPGFGNQSGTNTWAGNIDLAAGGTEYTIESVAGTLDVTGAISSGAVTGTVDLNLIGSGDGTVSGAISPGAGAATINLEKGGTGTWTLATANTYNGTTLITGGTLEAAADNAMGSTSGVTIQNGTLLLSGTGTNRISDTAGITLDNGRIDAPVTETFGALTLSNTNTISSIDMGTGTSLLTFGDSFTQTWTGILSIYNWSGTALTGGGTDQLYFIDQGAGGFDLANQQVQFYATSDNSTPLGGPGNNVYLPSGELVPIPEPATGFGALLLAALALAAGRRRRAARADAAE